MEVRNLRHKENEFAVRLIELRKKRNWSQQFVADKLGLSNRTICKWETGRGTPKLAILLALSSLFYDFFRGLRYLCYDQLLGKEFLNIQRHHAGSSPFECYLYY